MQLNICKLAMAARALLRKLMQTAGGGWKETNPNPPSTPTSCPSLPMTPLQYCQASRCTETVEQPSGGLPILVKRIDTSRSTANVSKQKPPRAVEEAPIVLVERKMELHRQLARLEEDH